MTKKLLFLLGLLFSLTLSSSAASKHIGTFSAGERIDGYGDITYDFVVPKYGLVEFVPADLFEENGQRRAIQYKIQDLAEKHTQGYFYLGGASGISYRGSLDYPNGWKIHMFPGTYRVKVYAGSSENRYSMSTTFTPAAPEYQFPKTGQSLFTNIKDAVSININTKYYDGIGYFASSENSNRSIQNSIDFFKFTLDKESDFEIQVAIDSTFTSNIGDAGISFYIWDSLTNISYSDYLTYYKDTSKNSSKIFHREAGDYYIHVSGMHSGNYSFKIVTANQTEIVIPTPPVSSCTIDTIWEQKDKFNPLYCPKVQSDGSILLPFAPWTNGRLGNDGYYDGNAIITQNSYDLLGEKIQVKFALSGADKYVSSFIGISDLSTGLPYQYLSTNHQWGPTKLVEHDKVIYYQMIIESDGVYTLSLSYKGYGQSDIHLDSDTLTSEQINSASNAYIYFNNGDNYGGIAASATLYELKIESLNSDDSEIPVDSDDDSGSGGGALGYFLPLLFLTLLFRRKED